MAKTTSEKIHLLVECAIMIALGTVLLSLGLFGYRFSGERIPTPNSNSLLQRFAPVVVSILVVLCIVGVPFSSSLVCSEDLLLAEGNGMANSFLLICLL